MYWNKALLAVLCSTMLRPCGMQAPWILKKQRNWREALMKQVRLPCGVVCARLAYMSGPAEELLLHVRKLCI